MTYNEQSVSIRWLRHDPKRNETPNKYMKK